MTSLIDVYTQLKTIINSPPLLIEIKPSNKNNEYKEWGHGLGNNNNANNLNVPKKGVFQSSGSNLNPSSLT